MSTKEYPNQRIVVDSLCKKDQKMWTVVQKVTHYRAMEEEVWEDKEASIKVLGDDLGKTFQQAAFFMSRLLEDYDYDLFNERKGDDKTNRSTD